MELLVKKLSTAYGKPTTPHKLRHTLATRLYEQTKDSLLVSQQLGHKGTAMVEVYAHVAAETTKEALEFDDVGLLSHHFKDTGYTL